MLTDAPLQAINRTRRFSPRNTFLHHTTRIRQQLLPGSVPMPLLLSKKDATLLRKHDSHPRFFPKESALISPPSKPLEPLRVQAPSDTFTPRNASSMTVPPSTQFKAVRLPSRNPVQFQVTSMRRRTPTHRSPLAPPGKPPCSPSIPRPVLPKEHTERNNDDQSGFRTVAYVHESNPQTLALTRPAHPSPHTRRHPVRTHRPSSCDGPTEPRCLWHRIPAEPDTYRATPVPTCKQVEARKPSTRTPLKTGSESDRSQIRKRLFYGI